MIFNLRDKEKLYLYHYYGGDQFVDYDIMNSVIAEMMTARWDISYDKYKSNQNKINDEIGALYVLVVDPDDNQYRDIIEDVYKTNKTILHVGVTSFFSRPATLQVLAHLRICRQESMSYSLSHQYTDDVKLATNQSGGQTKTKSHKLYFVCIQHNEKLNDWNQLLEND